MLWAQPQKRSTASRIYHQHEPEMFIKPQNVKKQVIISPSQGSSHSVSSVRVCVCVLQTYYIPTPQTSVKSLALQLHTAVSGRIYGKVDAVRYES